MNILRRLNPLCFQSFFSFLRSGLFLQPLLLVMIAVKACYINSVEFALAYKLYHTYSVKRNFVICGGYCANECSVSVVKLNRNAVVDGHFHTVGAIALVVADIMSARIDVDA